MPVKFNRNYRLYIDTNDGQGTITIEPPFTIEFNIQRSAMQTTNHMTLTIYNLSEKTRNRIFKDRYRLGTYQRIILEAGYGENLTKVYQGNIYEARSELVGPNIKTNIISRDGYFDVVQTQSFKTYGSGTTLRDIISDLVNDFPNVTRGIIGGENVTFNRPVSVEGNTWDTLRTYTRNQVFIDLERVNLLSQNQAFNNPVFVISPETGLLETPKRQDSFLSVVTLFEPTIAMGDIVELRSVQTPIYNGQYKVIGASHSGTISEAVAGELISVFNLQIASQLFGEFEKIGTE